METTRRRQGNTEKCGKEFTDATDCMWARENLAVGLGCEPVTANYPVFISY